MDLMIINKEFFVFKFLITKFLVVISLIATFPAQAQSDRLCPAQLQQEVEKIVPDAEKEFSCLNIKIETHVENVD